MGTGGRSGGLGAGQWGREQAREEVGGCNGYGPASQMLWHQRSSCSLKLSEKYEIKSLLLLQSFKIPPHLHTVHRKMHAHTNINTHTHNTDLIYVYIVETVIE